MMRRAQSARAASALELVTHLQRRFADRLHRLDQSRHGSDRPPFQRVEWLRASGRHGGGDRLEAPEGGLFDRGSVNVSQVQYDDAPEKQLGSATALSTIIHPRSPRAPSVHIHLSWTERKDGTGYWRIMADLNPSVPDPADREAFEAALKAAAPQHFEEAQAEGDRYFFIPALNRHRGTIHFYLESYSSGNFEADRELAQRVGTSAIDAYVDILSTAVERLPRPEDTAAQRDYHTLYLLQVLTLDRGTTSGLLVHDENDVGILGSLPSRVNGSRLAEWKGRMPPPQDQLVESLLQVLGSSAEAPVGTEQKRALAQAVREHYRTHPEALDLQASAQVVPPTVQNHA